MYRAGNHTELEEPYSVGKLADFTVLNKDIFVIPPTEILRTTVTHTVVGGEIVYKSD